MKKRKRKEYVIIHLLIIVMFLRITPGFTMSEGNDDVLMVVGDREVSKVEFLRLWKKNHLYAEHQSVEEYLDLFLDFQLKVAHARDEGIHLESSFRDELAGYRKNLAAPYLGDPDTEEKLLNEAYERLLYVVNVSHILVRLAPGFNPDDTLKAWEKAMQIRKRIYDGESFEEVARATSDDPSAKTNSGNLGYRAVFQLVYPFESQAYQAEIGEVSMPVRTRFGYHIIRVNDKKKSRGEIKVAHIMTGFNRYDEREAKELAHKIYDDLTGGTSFELLEEEFSTDDRAGQGGELPWFGIGRIVPEFEEAAFALEKPGDISVPVRTDYGWHIIKLIDSKDIPAFDEIKTEMRNRITNSRDERYQLIQDALVKRLRQEWEFSENRPALEAFYRIVDESIFNGTWSPPSRLPLNQVLFSVTGKKVTQREFAEFIAENASRLKPWPVDEYIYTLYQEFVNKWLINHEDANLEKKYPEFRFLMKEYKDGMLLFEITEREVWSRAISDSAGLAMFHEKRKDDYMWGKRILASIFSTEDSRIARRAARRANRSLRFDRRDDNWIIDRLNRRSEEDVITVERGIFSRGDNQLTDRIEWTEGVSEIFEKEDKYRIVLVHRIHEPEPKTLDEARGQVIADYQDYLEKIWLESLRDKYNVTVNKDVLSGIR